MNSYCYQAALVALLVTHLGCSNQGTNQQIANRPANYADNASQQSTNSMRADMQSPDSKQIKIEKPNELGYAKISIRDGDIYQEGIVDAQGKEVVQPRSHMLVQDITGNLALVGVENKFLFIPLDEGFVSSELIDSVSGFQYAEPYSCGLAMVCLDDVWFYLDSNFERAFEAELQFAEPFHHERALVKSNDRYRIIDTRGNTIADLNYDQVNLQSPWCWQVTRIEGKKYLSGFVDLNGVLITKMIYEDVRVYDPEVKRIRVTQNELFGFLDEHAKVVVPIKYDYASVFSRGKSRVILDGRNFSINPDGIEVPE
jgi:hypothetical protein